MNKSKGLVKKKTSSKPAQKNKVNQEEQKEFLMWLQQKLEIQSEEELNAQIQELGEEGVAQAYEVFQQEKQTAQRQAMRKGGLLDRLRELHEFKCGGKMKKMKNESGGKVKKLKLFTKDCCK